MSNKLNRPPLSARRSTLLFKKKCESQDLHNKGREGWCDAIVAGLKWSFGSLVVHVYDHTNGTCLYYGDVQSW